jgi:hypothetical protein
MNAPTKLAGKLLLHVMAWILFVVAAIAFWAGGRLISAVSKTGRLLAEAEGVGIAVVFVGLGGYCKAGRRRS